MPESPSDNAPDQGRRYHLATGVALLAFAGCALCTGVGVVACVVLANWREHLAVLIAFWAVLVATGVVAVALLRAALRLVHRAVVIRTDAVGYRVGGVRGLGTRSARWDEVDRVVADQRGGQQEIVVVLRTGGRTSIPVRLIAEPRVDWVADFDARLDQIHGYRRLR
ncbi:MAG: hypothetical protein ACRDP1_10760 [Nocardioidaceae bacterium]